MAFASIHVPDFPIQAVARTEPALRHHAIALVDGTPPLQKVVAANEAAMRAGIQLGMTKSQGAQFHAVEIRLRSQAQEKTAHAALLDLGWSISPRVEDAAPDTILADLAGLLSLFSSEENIVHELVQRASLLGLTANVAIASSIEAALLASHGFSGISLIPPGEESKRLGCLPVRVLPTSAEALETLERWGVRTCEALAALSLLDLSERLGQEGVRLHELARGAGSRSLVLAEANLSFEEEMALEDAAEELEPLAFILGRLLDQLCARLNARSLALHSIRLRFELEPSCESNPRCLNEDSSRPGHEKPALKSYEKVLTLPVPMRDSKMLLKLLRLQLQSDPPRAPILKVALAADPARPRAAQGGLFLPSSPDPEKLELTVARLANLVGDSNIGSPELADTHRPGEFHLQRFAPPRDSSEAGRRIYQRSSAQPAQSRIRRSATAFRACRPSLPARVELRHGRPVRVSFRGMRGDVVAASGPWRTSGDWWREDAWHQDEWDLEIRFDAASDSGHREQAAPENSRREPRCGVYCVYLDSIRQSWLVRGIYD